jgi:hypothetical protein
MAVNLLKITQDRRAMAPLAPHLCSPAASRPAAIIKTQRRTSRLHQRHDRRQTPACGAAQGAAAAAAAEPAWQVYTGKMPLVGFEKVAAALKYVQPAQQLLELHTYTLLQGPDQVRNTCAITPGLLQISATARILTKLL